MPQLRPDTAPILAGGTDIYVEALRWSGQIWMYPSAISYPSSTFYATDLVNGPPPVTPLFTPEDLEASLIPNNFLNVTELNPRQWQLVKAYLYAQHVEPTPGAPIPPDAPPEDPPPGYVAPVPSDFHDDNIPWIVRKLKELDKELTWMRSQMITRDTITGQPIQLSGVGNRFFDNYWDEGYDYEVSPMGFWVDVNFYPDYGGASDRSGLGLLYDAGSISWQSQGHSSAPIKLIRDNQYLGPVPPKCDHFHYNLAPEVEITVTAVYPTQFNAIETE